jgi:hypothetical protein
MFNVAIQLEYKANGYNAVSKHIREFTTHIQFNHDLEHLFGALQMACAHASHTKDLFTLYAVNNNASRDVAPADSLNLYTAMLYRYGAEGKIRCFIQKTLDELRDLKYDKRHGTQFFKELARTFLDIYPYVRSSSWANISHVTQ